MSAQLLLLNEFRDRRSTDRVAWNRDGENAEDPQPAEFPPLI
jgi:hypothetical protein